MNKAYNLLLSANNDNEFYLCVIALISCGENLSNIINFLNKNNIKFSLVKYAIYYKNYYTRIIYYGIKNEYKDIITEYDNVISLYSKLAKDLGFARPLEFGLFFEYLLFNGYFSVSKEFKCSKDFKKYGPYSISTGTGVCSNISMMFVDFLSKCGVNSMLLINYFKGFDNDLKYFLFGNHAAVLVYDEKDFLYDITNKEVAYQEGINKYKSLSGRYEYLDRNHDGIKPDMCKNRGLLNDYYNECKKKVEEIVSQNSFLISAARECAYYDIFKMASYLKETKQTDEISKIRKK